MRVLVIDDDRAVREGLERVLRRDGFEVVLAPDGQSARLALAGGSLDAVILDLLLPDCDGVGLCRELRQAGDRTPVLMLTARDAVADRVAGLEAGADDYLVKPFALEELRARVRALLRRAGPADGNGLLRCADVELDPVAYEARRGARALALTRTEFHLLELFLRHPRQVLTRSVILERVWGYDFGSASRSLDVYIGYLRRKLEAGGEPRVLHTVRGVGYVLRAP